MTDKLRQKKLLRDRGICVLIPTYNNGGTVAGVVRRALAECDDVIVVDDGSTDDTAKLLEEMSHPHLTVVSHDRNRGKGRALQTGFAKAMDMGFSHAITIDADGQHFPEDIPLFLEANRQHPYALIMGSRCMEGMEQDSGSRFANKFSNFWFYVQTGRRLSDTQTGYRLYPLKALPLRGFLTSRYEAELELLVFASWHGTELVPIDIRVYYPPREERVSHFRPAQDFARISLLNTVLCFLAVVYGLPLRLWRWLMKYVRTWFSLLFFLFFSIFVINPAVWLYVKCGRMTEQKRLNLHRLIQWLSRSVMIKIGIPGTTFAVSHASQRDKAAGHASLRDLQHFDTPHIIISNHQSALDLMCIMMFSPRLVFLTNDWVWHNPFFGYLIRHAEYYPVSKGIDQLMPRLQSLVERGYSIAIFPEGTRSPDCRIGRFHRGAFHIAQQLGLDILPVCLYGPGKVLPKKSSILHKGPICVEVAQPVSRQELNAIGDTMKQASAMCGRYREWYEDLCNRMER